VNGNVIGLFTGSSTITGRETYAPWGALETGALTTLADTNRLRWKGLVWEGDSTQLYYVRARWYDPLSRRFVSEDPLGIDGGINPYVYAANDPITGWDPAGLLPVVQYMDPVFSVDPCEPNGDYAEMFEFNVDCQGSDAYINDANPAPPWLWLIGGGGAPPNERLPHRVSERPPSSEQPACTLRSIATTTIGVALFGGAVGAVGGGIIGGFAGAGVGATTGGVVGFIVGLPTGIGEFATGVIGGAVGTAAGTFAGAYLGAHLGAWAGLLVGTTTGALLGVVQGCVLHETVDDAVTQALR